MLDRAKQPRYCSHVEQEPLSPTHLIGAQVAKVRKSRGMTQEELAEAMQAVGLDWQRVVVAKLEKGLRPFVKVDELLALCVVLEISPVDLLVPKDLDDDQPYQIAPKATARTKNAREWVRGEDLFFVSAYPEPPVDPESPFADPARALDPIRWMPEDRARRVARRYFDGEGSQS